MNAKKTAGTHRIDMTVGALRVAASDFEHVDDAQIAAGHYLDSAEAVLDALAEALNDSPGGQLAAQPKLIARVLNGAMALQQIGAGVYAAALAESEGRNG